jgi:thymidylate synthase
MITRESYDLPTLKVNGDIQKIKDFRFDDFTIIDYETHPNIKMNVAI